jgi:hypothetical protein
MENIISRNYQNDQNIKSPEVHTKNKLKKKHKYKITIHNHKRKFETVTRRLFHSDCETKQNHRNYIHPTMN